MQIMWRIEDQARETSGLVGLGNEVIAAWDLMYLSVTASNHKPRSKQNSRRPSS
jgi:hypothetical protein